MRVISVLLGNTDVKKQNEVSKDLSEELWEISSVINDIRLVERFKKEQINLLDIKQQISAIKQQFEDNQRRNNESEEEFADRLNDRILELVIPIVNTTNKLFPHRSNKSPSNIAAILYRNEAVCSGKAEVISSIMKLIGLESAPIFVIQTNDDYHEGHAISKTNLLGKTILFADANYNSTGNINPIIQRESTRLLYTAKKVPNNNDSNPNIFKMLGTNGEILFYESDTDAPHKIIADREKGSISFDHNNFATHLKKYYQKLGLSKQEAMNQAQHHYLEALRIDPNHSSTHYNFALLLKQNYQELGLSKQEAMKQASYHYQEALRIDPNHSLAHSNFANLLKQYYQELGLSKKEAVKHVSYHYQETLKDTNFEYYLWIMTLYADFLLNFVGDKQNALSKYQIALKLMNDNPHLPNWLTKNRIEEIILTI